MRILLPASGDGDASATLASHCFQDGLRAGFEKEASYVFAKRGGLVRGGGGALADVLRAIDRADTGFEDEFAAFGACPSSERNLAATL